ncbi:cell division protein CrgA [Arsenicicoccus piscis]|uniref:Cell division protein CrgA n=1 Tax=Arsenicicoccus piscis TaxID=673954 RepID=A0ABQ6HUB4_9MICO|nr:cell division protein CrgA [Arsenicicoccus piscis]MCH8627396.1 cell division protein CrgA [Arsenicicoccus piscis]GMA21557.1 cell division protein CrgA [Arsenicicoccus piscis]
MPESKGRAKPAYTPPAKTGTTKVTPSPSWWAPTMVTLMVIGLVWVVVYYLSQAAYPIPGITWWNLVIGFAVMLAGFLMTTRWR